MKRILPLLYNLGEVIHLEASTCFRRVGDYMQLPHVSQRTFDYHTPLKTKDSTDLRLLLGLFHPPSFFLLLCFFSTACHDFFFLSVTIFYCNRNYPGCILFAQTSIPWVYHVAINSFSSIRALPPLEIASDTKALGVKCGFMSPRLPALPGPLVILLGDSWAPPGGWSLTQCTLSLCVCACLQRGR